MRRSVFLIALIGLAPFASAQPASAAPASNGDIHQLVADKQYGAAMQKITAGLALKGPAAKTVDRADLFMQKAECHLQLRALTPAIAAYDSAAKEAAKNTDTRLASIATAHAALLKGSKAFAYTPKTAPDKTRPVPIDILDPAHRRQAFLAMLVDHLAASESKLKAAKAATSLPPIAACFKPLDEMEGMELAAKENSTAESSGAEKVTALRKDLTETAKKMMADSFRAMSKRIGDIDKEAGTYVEFYEDVPDPFNAPAAFRRRKAWKKKGLTDADTKELEAATVTCDKISPALTELAVGLKQEEKTFDPFSDEASRIRKEVERILDTDYLKIYRTPPK